MARRAPLTSLRQISEINLTPLMDLTFILLITFIITFPLIEQGIPVELPSADAEDLVTDRTETITIDLKGRVFFNDAEISLEALASRLQALGQSAPDTAVMIRADERIMYGRVVEVLKLLHSAQLSKMALVTQSEGAS